MIRSGADEIRRAFAISIRDNFNVGAVNGLVEAPAVTQNPTRQTQEPYIYVYSVTERETDVTKECAPIEYTVNVEVCIRFNQRRGGQRQAQQCLDEVLRIVRGFGIGQYPEAVGYTIYRTTFGIAQDLIFKEGGANYYKVICPLFVSAYLTPEPDQVLPVQAPTFMYEDFTFEPAGFTIERFDSGTIIPDTTYPSGNNGWDFVDANFSISSGGAGTFSSGRYTIPAGGEPVSLDSTLRYNLNADPTETTSLSATTQWNVIDSIRYGSIVPETAGTIPTLVDDDSATYGLRNLANWNVEFGTVTPHQEMITLTGDPGEYLYIIVDQGVTLTQIVNNGVNTISLWDVQTVGNYRIYINQQPIVFADFSIDYNLVGN